MDILTGKIQISNKQLHDLATGTEEDIQELIRQLEEGTFVSRSPSNNQDLLNDDSDDLPEKDDLSDSSETQPWEKQFIKMTDDFRTMIKTQSKPDDTKSVKSALRQYIEMLEELYSNL